MPSVVKVTPGTRLTRQPSKITSMRQMNAFKNWSAPIGSEKLNKSRARVDVDLARVSLGKWRNNPDASANATRPDAHVPTMAAISGAKIREPRANAARKASVVTPDSVKPRE